MTKQHRELVSAFSKSDLDFRCSLWEKKGYHREGNYILQYMSFVEKSNYVTRPVYLQPMLLERPDIIAEVEDDGA